MAAGLVIVLSGGENVSGKDERADVRFLRAGEVLRGDADRSCPANVMKDLQAKFSALNSWKSDR